MSYKYDLIVFVGRFQLFHNGHKQVIESGLSQASFVLVLIGSAFQPRTPRNPWTSSERAQMIADAMLFDSDTNTNDRLIIRPMRDQRYNDQAWVESIQTQVAEILAKVSPNKLSKVAIIGHSKDDTWYYLKMFPQWNIIEHPMVDLLNATDIRQIIYENRSLSYLNGIVPPTVLQTIVEFKKTEEFALIQQENNQLIQYKKAWSAAPYPPIFVTVHAMVIQSGHILVVRRKHSPGQGLLALCGGFVNQNETLQQAMLRELREETKIKVPVPVLKGSIVYVKPYDDPNRSLRGRTITHTFLIHLPPGELPKVKGSDDATESFWLPLSEIRSDDFFEDHYDQILDMIGKL